ncbi:response regulator transcription factor [Paenibacillus motobuensis]|uniref:Response regulator transcription factor n=1 Tax=Paenibacillus motobuensis TaxID=295324 RepID=A0ABP3IMR4_9BACL
MKIKVLIADDNSFIREGMRIILNSFEEFEVLATVEDGREAVEFCQAGEVDVALLDVRMPNMNGVEATRLITETTKTKPLILTTFDDDEYITDAIRFGAKGYLLKNNDPERIRDAIRSIHHGHNVLQNVILDKLKLNLGDHTPVVVEPPIDVSLFTERELEVMSSIARGLSNKEISKELFISEGTVANYITSLLNKTGLEHRTQIAIYYLTGRIR